MIECSPSGNPFIFKTQFLWPKHRNPPLPTSTHGFAPPLCCPSRTTLNTGRYLFRNGALTNTSSHIPSATDEPSLARTLKQAGYVISTNSYPHVWPWFYNMAAKNSPLADVRVRQGLNYCIDRGAIVSMLNGTAEPSVGWLKPTDAAFGNPEHRYTFDPAKGKKLL